MKIRFIILDASNYELIQNDYDKVLKTQHFRNNHQQQEQREDQNGSITPQQQSFEEPKEVLSKQESLEETKTFPLNPKQSVQNAEPALTPKNNNNNQTIDKTKNGDSETKKYGNKQIGSNTQKFCWYCKRHDFPDTAHRYFYLK